MKQNSYSCNPSIKMVSKSLVSSCLILDLDPDENDCNCLASLKLSPRS